ncbi:SNARE Ykt6 [Paracoccidioides lutzii Pb01]|uniref:SNARE Ykt6 n=1 Tax=Paracoccidioides lutzii (strain ATCC MYA-826 / Pb01) TaxID=502779 RepID=C1GSU3_PARBA|nr:SNARE Ykt6 [Paracoccidioides lutzii Pb01]EEH39126.1 SNARE Ykt6 [Paracoccidioides lutzii Pb01]
MTTTGDIIYIGFFSNDKGQPPEELYGADSIVDSILTRFIRKSQLELITFVCKTLLEKATVNDTAVTVIKDDVDSQNVGVLYCFKPHDRPATVVVARPSYSEQIARSIAKGVQLKIRKDFAVPQDFDLTLQKRSSVERNKLGIYDEAVVKAKSKLKEYAQDPGKADELAKIQQQLDDTKQVLYQTVDKMLERGEKLDSLIAKSDNLSMQSRAFAAQAKKQNSCCLVM